MRWSIGMIVAVLKLADMVIK
ncbi:hypothetical protein CCP3SC1_1040007 [Gammaproteobacteria bacterium]